MDFLHNTRLLQDGLTSPAWHLVFQFDRWGLLVHFSQVFFVKDEQGQAIVQVKYGDGDKSA